MSGISYIQDVHIDRPNNNEGLLNSSSLAPTTSMQPISFESDKPHHGSTSTTL